MVEATPSGRHRIDIQVMRAVAVLAVVIYHGGFDLLPGGYLGVDIFFVISGFLMSGIILRELDERRFKLTDFYMRRAVRLLPASLCTLLFTTLAASVLLTWSAWQDFVKQLFGSLTFTANYVLMGQAGYFEEAAETKPLLHMWSLSLEEQFYLFLPLALMFLTKRLRMPALFLGTALSLAMCWGFAVGIDGLPISLKTQQSLVFYSLPTRAWEMLLGCIAAGALLRFPLLRVPVAASWITFAVILYVIAFPLSIEHPGIDAVVATLAMMALLFSRERWLPANIITTVASKIGDWSYSIYLVHWPLFAFATTYFLDEPSLAVRIALVAGSIFLGWLQYRFVEQQFRTDRHQHRIRKALGYLGVTTLVAATGLAMTSIAFAPEQRIDRPKATGGLARTCRVAGTDWNDPAECRRGDRPTIALWGDSYAMHWNPALSELAGERGLVQITKVACPPLLGITHLSVRYNEKWAQNCVAWNDDVLKKLNARPEIETVILASLFTQVITSEDFELYERGKRIPASIETGVSALAKTIEALQSAGKKVIVIEQTPSTGTDYGTCALRRLSARPTAASIEDCSFPIADALELYGDTFAAMERVAEAHGTKYVRPRDVLCSAGQCQTFIEGQMLYRDPGHLTEFGSGWVLDRMNLFADSSK